MKIRAKWLVVVPAVALGLGACSKKEAAKKVEAPATVVEAPVKESLAAPVVPEAPKVPDLTAEARAAKIGFAKFLRADTEIVTSFYDGSKSASRVKSSRLWKMIRNEIGAGLPGMDDAGADPDADPGAPPVEEDAAAVAPAAEDEPTGPAMLFGKEFTIAFGKASGEQAANLLTAERRMGYFQIRNGAKALIAVAKSGKSESMNDTFSNLFSAEVVTELLKDPESGMALVERTNMPPIYFAFRVDDAQRPAAAQQIAAMLANANMLGEMVEPVETEKAGHKFAGFKLSGAKVSQQMATDRADMDQTLDAATVDQLLAAIAKKDMVLASGTIGEYVVLFIGSSIDDLNLATDAAQSLAGSEALKFVDGYATKDVAALIYGQDAAMDQMDAAAGGIADIVNGLRDGISGADGIGDTRDLEAMLQIVAEREAVLRKLVSIEATGTVAYFEEGLKIESFGGWDNGAIAPTASNKLAHLGDSDDVVLFSDVTSDSQYSEKAHAFYESLFETAYALGVKLTELPLENEEIAKYKEMVKLFDTKFRPDTVALWDAFNDDFRNSLGDETAFVVDLKGSAPAVPGIPQAVVDQAKVPRISMISPVTDRAKLSGSWDKMNSAATGVLAKVSEMVGQQLPMQRPMSSEKNGLVSWFFPLPFFNDDFLPSVTVGDQWFAASTSKNQALDLIAKAAAGKETGTGMYFLMNFRALETYAQQTAKIVAENSEALTGTAFTPEDNKRIKNWIAAFSDMDKLTVHIRHEGATQRTSIHFKTR